MVACIGSLFRIGLATKLHPMLFIRNMQSNGQLQSQLVAATSTPSLGKSECGCGVCDGLVRVKYGWVQGKTQCLICRLNEFSTYAQ